MKNKERKIEFINNISNTIRFALNVNGIYKKEVYDKSFAKSKEDQYKVLKYIKEEFAIHDCHVLELYFYYEFDYYSEMKLHIKFYSNELGTTFNCNSFIFKSDKNENEIEVYSQMIEHIYPDDDNDGIIFSENYMK